MTTKAGRPKKTANTMKEEEKKKESTRKKSRKPTWLEKIPTRNRGKEKELTEGHYEEWSLRLNLTQYGKTHQVQT